MIQQLLLGGQVLVVVLVYLFVWRVMRAARRDIAGAGTAPTRRQGGAAAGAGVASAGDAGESTIIPPAQAAAARRSAGLADPRVTVRESDVVRAGVPYQIMGSGLSLGRGDDNDLVLDESTVSSRHARLLPPGLVHDLGSTNGTYVNGTRIEGRARLHDGDVMQIGSTVFVFSRSGA